MLSCYEMYDLHYIICCIRSSPCNPINHDVLETVIKVINNRHYCDEQNQFRTALQPLLKNHDERQYSFVQTKNEYCYFPLPFLKDEKVYFVLCKAFEKLLEAIDEKNERKIYDLADSLHNLPIYLIENKYVIPKAFWKNEIKCYRQKWERTFLDAEQKMIQ